MLEWILSSSVLIVLVILVRVIFRGKIKAELQYALWGLVLLRLLLPGALFSSPISVTNVLPDEKALVAPVHPGNLLENLPEVPEELRAGQNDSQTVEQAVKPDVQQTVIHWETIIKMIWLAGSCIVGAVFVVSNLVFRHRLCKTRTPLDVPTCPLMIYESDAAETPCLFGILRPSIYVTADVAADPVIMRHAVAHEWTHYRHGDHLWAILRVLCLAVHWFNPLVWCAVVLSRRDGELACDEATICRLGEGERAAYGKTLLRLTCQRPTNFFRTATTMTGSQREIRERIVRIVKHSKMTVVALVLVLLLAAMAVGCTFTGRETTPPLDENIVPKETDEQEEINAPETTDPEKADTEPTTLAVPPDFEVRRGAEEIVLYPFTNEELTSAAKVVQQCMDGASTETGVLTYEVERIAYDPMMTDVHVRQMMAGSPVAGWTEKDYYEHHISFAVTYSATYDHTKSPFQDVSHGVISVSLSRETAQATWEFKDSGAPVEEYSDRAMSAEELADAADADGRVLAGYKAGDDILWFYLWDDAAGKVQFIQENL